MRRTIRWLCALSMLALLNLSLADADRLPEEWGRRPLAFEANLGQTDPRVSFLARGPGYSAFLTPSEVVAVAHNGGGVLRLRWVGAATPAPAGEGELPGRIHYLGGSDPAGWRTGVRSYERVRYRDVYPGIDLVFHGDPRRLEHDFVVTPGADPRAIRLAFTGAGRPRIQAGALVASTHAGEVRLLRPVSFQEVQGDRQEVPSCWRQRRDGTFGFDVGRYDRTRPLVIDPVLVYSSYLGGRNDEQGNSIAVDAAGNAYVTGFTTSPDFPPLDGSRPPAGTVFVTKVAPSGALVYTTLFGGSGYGAGFGIVVDRAGAVYVTGLTESPDFPRVNPLPIPPRHGEGSDAFVVKLAPSGSSFLYATNLGGSSPDIAFGIAVDPTGHAYVAGVTGSADFPATSRLAPPPGSIPDAFVAKLAPSGSSLVWSTRLGGSSADTATGVAVAASGHVLVGGSTGSTDFPAVQAFQGSFGGGGSDAFVAMLAPSGSSLVWSSYAGGSGADDALGIAVDSRGGAHLAGRSESADFPTARALQPVPAGFSDGFVLGVAVSGALVYSTYLGGSGFDQAQGIAVDGSGRIFLTGTTGSADFPLRDPIQDRCEPDDFYPACPSDAFVTTLGPGGSPLLFSTFLGGMTGAVDPLLADDEGVALALGVDSDVYLTGVANAVDFPTVWPFQPAHGGGGIPFDGFVARITLDNRPPDCATAIDRPGLLWPPDGKLHTVAVSGVSDPDGDPVSIAIASIHQDEPLSRGGAQDATGVGTAAAWVRADRLGGGDGRVYLVRFEARDGRGGSCAGEVRICVPHDRRPGASCGDGGPIHDSTGPGLQR